MSKRDIILFVGNPGTGKSTLLNCLAGKQYFTSGCSANGAGVTSELQMREVDNVIYMDTPGLADVNMQEEAAVYIRNALKITGVYRIFFLVRIDTGRVTLEDISTIQYVMSAIKMEEEEHLEFSVIANKVSPIVYKRIFDVKYKGYDEESQRQIIKAINTGNHATQFVYFLQEMDELRDMENEIVTLPAEFLQFVRDAPSIVIKTKH